MSFLKRRKKKETKRRPREKKVRKKEGLGKDFRPGVLGDFRRWFTGGGTSWVRRCARVNMRATLW